MTVSYLEIYNEDPTFAAGSHGQRGWTTARPWLFRMLAIQIYTVDDKGVLRFMDCSNQKAIIHHLDLFSLSQTWLESVLVGCVSSWNSRAKSANLFELLRTR